MGESIGGNKRFEHDKFEGGKKIILYQFRHYRLKFTIYINKDIDYDREKNWERVTWECAPYRKIAVSVETHVPQFLKLAHV